MRSPEPSHTLQTSTISRNPGISQFQVSPIRDRLNPIAACGNPGY
jgi:hypothetical protein